jgi:SAM-dependent methyltransferase
MKQEIYSHLQQIEQAHWWYVARRKIIFDWVGRVLPDYVSPKLLDIGCGTGFNVAYLEANGYSQVTGLDFSTEALMFCRSRHLPYLICGDGVCPPFSHHSFDIILALDLIEHLEDDRQALREITRLLKPNGSLIIFTPAFNFLWGLQDEVGQHYRRYTACDLRQKLQAVGLRIDKLTYANTFLFPFIWAGRLALRWRGNKIRGTSENDLHPAWSNKLLQAIFAAERPLLRRVNFPFGVSLLCIARKSDQP